MNNAKTKKLNEVCSTIVKTCAGVKKGEEVLLLTDESTSIDIIKTFQSILNSLDATVCIIRRNTPARPHDLPPSPVVWSMRGANLIIDLSKYDITHTLPVRIATFDYSARLIVLAGMKPEDLIRPNIADIDYEEINHKATCLIEKLESGSTFRYTTPNGTNLKADITNRKWWALSGIVREPGIFTVFPIGEVLGSAVHGTITGTAVIEFMALFGKLKIPITMTIEKGWVTEIEGGEEAQKLRAMWSKVKNANYVGELGGIGLNPMNTEADTLDTIEVGNKLGAAHIGVGDSLDFGQRISSDMHLNATMLDITVEVDGKAIVADNQILV